MMCVVYWKSAVQSPIKRTTTTYQSVRQTHSSMCLCTPTQVICIRAVSAQTQLELNIFWHFLWKHHNSTSNSLVRNALYSWGTETHADTHFCKIFAHVEAHCDGESEIGQRRINTAWCKRPCAGFTVWQREVKLTHFPGEKPTEGGNQPPAATANRTFSIRNISS